MKNTWSYTTNNTLIYFSQYQKKTNAKKKNQKPNGHSFCEQGRMPQVEELKSKNWIKG